MDSHLQHLIYSTTGATDFSKLEVVQTLWSGYGSIDRYVLKDAEVDTLIVKHIKLPEQSNHPRGWNTDLSHQRKLRSYRVESYWYQHWASHCNDSCRVPHCFAVESQNDETLILLEDLDSSGFPGRKHRAGQQDMVNCLCWLANFHAIFIQKKPTGLWPVGTYWHLKTRPDELETMPQGKLKDAASALDQLLNRVPYRSLVHGDAKLANFCFSKSKIPVAAVDFQYVGGGCGMKDVAYFISSCLDEHGCERMETILLDAYFSSLRSALRIHQPEIDSEEVEKAWRPLYAVAWTDFYRFLQGWSPGHWKIHDYSERLAREVISALDLSEGRQGV